MPLSPQHYCHDEDNTLFQALKSQQWDVAASLLQKLANSRDAFNNTPLHTAIGFRAPDSLILSLLKMYPEACRVHGTDDWLPLHIATMWGASKSVLRALIVTYPQALEDTGQGGIKGRTPRHFATKFLDDERRRMLERTCEQWMQEICNSSC